MYTFRVRIQPHHRNENGKTKSSPYLILRNSNHVHATMHAQESITLEIPSV